MRRSRATGMPRGLRGIVPSNKRNSGLLVDELRIRRRSCSSVRMMTFGKHRGQTFEKVGETESGYVRWALEQEKPSGGLAEFVSFLPRCRACVYAGLGRAEETQQDVERTQQGSACSLGSVKKQCTLARGRPSPFHDEDAAWRGLLVCVRDCLLDCLIA